MLNDEILERIFANKEMQKIPIGTQATAVSVFEHVLEEIKEEKPYVNVSELLTDDILISTYPDLKKVLDDNTKSYKDQQQAVDNYIDSIKNQAMAEAAMEALKDEYKGLFKAQKAVADVESSYLELQGKNRKAAETRKKALQKLNAAQETLNHTYENSDEWWAATAALEAAQAEFDAADEANRVAQDNYLAVADTYHKYVNEAQKCQDRIDYLSDEYSNAMGNMTTAAQDMADAQSEAYDQVSSDAIDSYDKVKQASQDCVDSVMTILNSGDYWQAGNNASINVSNGLRNGITLVGSAAAALTESIKKNLPTNVYQTKGKDMITELNNGLNNSSSLNVVFATAKSIGDKINELLGYGKKTITVDIQQTPMQWAGANTTGIRTYATGGFPEDGLFFANHNELVGQFSNGKTAVANNEQIMEGIKWAAYEGMSMALSQYGGGNTSVNVVLEGDADGLFKAVQGKANNYTRQTGKPAFMT